ncbi:unnamed protein product, partial [Mesorhabditis spiculigera]
MPLTRSAMRKTQEAVEPPTAMPTEPYVDKTESPLDRHLPAIEDESSQDTEVGDTYKPPIDTEGSVSTIVDGRTDSTQSLTGSKDDLEEKIRAVKKPRRNKNKHQVQLEVDEVNVPSAAEIVQKVREMNRASPKLKRGRHFAFRGYTTPLERAHDALLMRFNLRELQDFVDNCEGRPITRRHQPPISVRHGKIDGHARRQNLTVAAREKFGSFDQTRPSYPFSVIQIGSYQSYHAIDEPTHKEQENRPNSITLSPQTRRMIYEFSSYDANRTLCYFVWVVSLENIVALHFTHDLLYVREPATQATAFHGPVSTPGLDVTNGERDASVLHYFRLLHDTTPMKEWFLNFDRAFFEPRMLGYMDFFQALYGKLDPTAFVTAANQPAYQDINMQVTGRANQYHYHPPQPMETEDFNNAVIMQEQEALCDIKATPGTQTGLVDFGPVNNMTGYADADMFFVLPAQASGDSSMQPSASKKQLIP